MAKKTKLLLWDYKDTSLIKKALAIKVKGGKKQMPLTQAEIDLCYSWAAREITNLQFNRVIGMKDNYNPAYILAKAVRQQLIG